MFAHFRPAIVLLMTLTIITGGLYPLGVTILARMAAPNNAEGSLLIVDGHIIGSHLIGQNFTDPGYFHGRPSATTDVDPDDATKTIAVPYNASNSGGSNLGPTSKALLDRVKEDADKLGNIGLIPADLLTTSASGLDPHLSPAAILTQVSRVAQARGMTEQDLRLLIERHIIPRWLGLLGEPIVNVLELNVALDEIAPKSR